MHANVTSTVALFIALAGGVAYGANAIVDDSKDVASQAITNSDVKKNVLKSNRLKDGAAVTSADVKPDSLGAAAINEADLAQVPSAATATNAGTAADSQALGGLAADQFARNSQVVVGGPVGAGLTTQTIVNLARLGIEIRTDGDADTDSTVRVVNTNDAGGREYIVTYGVDSGSQFLSSPGGNQAIQPGDPIAGGLIQIAGRNGPAASALVSCVFSGFDTDRRISCLAMSS